MPICWAQERSWRRLEREEDLHQEKLNQVYEFLITSCAEIQEREAVGNTVDGFDASGCLPACEANVCIDALSAGSE